MWFVDYEIEMLPKAIARWNSLPMEDRITLGVAFREAVMHPQRVGTYALSFRKLRSGQVAQIHSFRFGYANFIIMTTQDSIVMEDLWLDPDYAIAAD